jgi:hypothetical protein
MINGAMFNGIIGIQGQCSMVESPFCQSASKSLIDRPWESHWFSSHLRDDIRPSLARLPLLFSFCPDWGRGWQPLG